MGQRLGGLCVGACDSDGAMRSVFFATYGKQSLENLKLMGTDPRTLRAADVVCCGFCCKPFTPCGLQKGWEDETFGDNYDLMVDGTPRSVGSNHGTSHLANVRQHLCGVGGRKHGKCSAGAPAQLWRAPAGVWGAPD